MVATLTLSVNNELPLYGGTRELPVRVHPMAVSQAALCTRGCPPSTCSAQRDRVKHEGGYCRRGADATAACRCAVPERSHVSANLDAYIACFRGLGEPFCTVFGMFPCSLDLV